MVRMAAAAPALSANELRSGGGEVEDEIHIQFGAGIAGPGNGHRLLYGILNLGLGEGIGVDQDVIAAWNQPQVHLAHDPDLIIRYRHYRYALLGHGDAPPGRIALAVDR